MVQCFVSCCIVCLNSFHRQALIIRKQFLTFPIIYYSFQLHPHGLSIIMGQIYNQITQNYPIYNDTYSPTNIHTHCHKTIGIITVTLSLMVLAEIYAISVPIISLDGINGSLSVTLELNCTPSVLGVEINTSKYGPLNQQQLCPSATQPQEF